jgi:hypothetical protein
MTINDEKTRYFYVKSRKIYILLTINTRGVRKMDELTPKNEKVNPFQNDLGFILWKLQSIEDFLPCYHTMMKQE